MGYIFIIGENISSVFLEIGSFEFCLDIQIMPYYINYSPCSNYLVPIQDSYDFKTRIGRFCVHFSHVVASWVQSSNLCSLIGQTIIC